MNKILTALAALALILGVAACESGSKSEDSREREQEAIGEGFDRVTRSQQVPSFDYSQERQTLIDVLTIRAEGTHGTAYATTMEGQLIWWCPSVGAPVPSTYQLTNPDQIIGGDGANTEEQVLPLGEPTGVYTGDSAATWTVCLDDNGTAFGKYEEANVGWTSGVVNGLDAAKRARVDEITFEFTDPEG
jgi:hypothetical protein